MTLNELIERLEEYRELHGGESEVKLMMQQNWPFEYSIGGLCSQEDITRLHEVSGDEDYDDEADDDTIYLVEGTQLGYGTKLAWEAAQ